MPFTIEIVHAQRREPLRKGIYIVPTDHWYIERTVWLVAGVVLLTGTTLAALVHPLWVLLVTELFAPLSDRP